MSVSAAEKFAYDIENEGDVFMVMFIILMTMAIMSLCQKKLLISYVIGAAYVLIRTYFLINDVKKWVRNLLFIILGYLVSYILARIHI